MKAKTNKIKLLINIIITTSVIVGGMKVYKGFTTLSKAECRNALSVKYSRPTQQQKDLATRCQALKE